MPSTLRYGAGSTVEVELAPERLLAVCGTPQGTALADPAAALTAALAAPLDFPPLKSATIPGDKVSLAVEHGVPQAAALVGAIVRTLVDEAGTRPADICILQARGDHGAKLDDLRASLPAEYRRRVETIVHDPSNRDLLSYLAADEAGEPIYINRRLFDADVVLPVGCLRLETAVGYYGVNATLYPAFSDQPTLERFHAAGASATPEEIARRRHEADEVAWLLGVLLTIQIVPAAGSGILHVLAGAIESVQRRGKALCDEAWSCRIPGRADLVVAAIEGDREQQNWENVGRALSAAARAVTDDGAIALCTELAENPGPALRWLRRAGDPRSALRHIRRQRTADAATAHELAQALQRVQVYLLSGLDESVVEELGVAHVSAASEIARLASRHRSCILLSNAQYALPTPVEEVSES